MNLSLQVSCSRCGHRSRRFAFDEGRRFVQKSQDELIEAGWDTFGDAFYCPKCAKSWEKRNGKDRPLWGEEYTRYKVMVRIIDVLMDEIERQSGRRTE